MSNRKKIQISKKAQIGETMTWVVATIIIIVTLIIFIYVSSLLKEIRNIKLPDLKIDSKEDVNWLEAKTSFAHSLADNKNKKEIDKWIGIDEWIKGEIVEMGKDTVVIHYTAGEGFEQGVEDVLKNRGLSVQYILEREGEVSECEIYGYKLKECILKDVSKVTGEWEKTNAQHTGCRVNSTRPFCYSPGEKPDPKKYEEDKDCCRRGFNQRSVGIEIINLGWLCGTSHKSSCQDKGDGFESGGYVWQNYTKEQMDSLVDLVAGIVERNNISVDRDHIIGHYEVDPGNKVDPGPAFPWNKFMKDLESKVGEGEIRVSGEIE